MNRRFVWFIGALLLVGTTGVLLAFAQQEKGADVTIEDLHRLLVNDEGQSRLEILEEWVRAIDEEVDLIHSVAEKMLEEQYGFFAQEEWTLDDVKFQLNTIDAMLQDIKGCLGCP